MILFEDSYFLVVDNISVYTCHIYSEFTSPDTIILFNYLNRKENIIEFANYNFLINNFTFKEIPYSHLCRCN